MPAHSSLPPSEMLAVPPTRPRAGASGKIMDYVGRILPGLLLCLAVKAAAIGLKRVEAAAFGATWL